MRKGRPGSPAAPRIFPVFHENQALMLSQESKMSEWLSKKRKMQGAQLQQRSSW
jgi:hypothetical protein